MNKQLRYFIISSIILGWVVFYSKVILDGHFRMDFYLPAELCNLMQMTIVYAVAKNKMKMLDAIMYPAILGPFAALLYPFGIATFGPFYLAYFLYYHFTLIFVGIYRLIQRKGDVNIRDLGKSIAFMSVSAAIATIVNHLTGGNYMFVSQAIFPTPFHYQTFLVLFAITGVSLFHFAIVMGRVLINNNKIKSFLVLIKNYLIKILKNYKIKIKRLKY